MMTVEFVCEQFAEYLRGSNFICEALMSNDDEYDVCSQTCDWQNAQPQCVQRYCEMKWRESEHDTEEDRKNGHWVHAEYAGYECDQCGNYHSFADNFCPHCGAVMVKGAET